MIRKVLLYLLSFLYSIVCNILTTCSQLQRRRYFGWLVFAVIILTVISSWLDYVVHRKWYDAAAKGR